MRGHAVANESAITDGEQQFFKDTWQIDVAFSVAGP
jgi:hypothetical protein